MQQMVTLRNGIEMPLVGFGLFQIKEPDECEACILEAIKAGYRLFDTAADFDNEVAVGKALKKAVDQGLVRREELFITTKLSIEDTREDAAEEAFEASLSRLQLDYIDLYLIHQPYNDCYGAWRILEKLYRQGKVRAIGVSNFTPERLTDFCMNNQIPPMVDQIESHPFYHQTEAIRNMKELGVQPQAWAPLCEGLKNIFLNKVLLRIGKKYGKSAAQAALRWNIDRKAGVVVKSRNPEHIRENMDIWDFALSERDKKLIEEMDIGYSEILDYRSPGIARMFIQKKERNKAGIARVPLSCTNYL